MEKRSKRDFQAEGYLALGSDWGVTVGSETAWIEGEAKAIRARSSGRGTSISESQLPHQ